MSVTSSKPAPPHAIARRYHAEDLVRIRRASEKRRYVSSQRRAKIDPNPHQIDAVMFALSRIPSGGCILADEVGLGKTIEAGLVIAQLLAEGAQRVLIVLPRSLIGQWQDELYSLFHIHAAEADVADVDLDAPGVFLAGREYAGGNAGFARLSATTPFDLCLVDEAHEVFAGIHRRYDQYGVYNETSPHARTAHRVREIMGASPVLLMTATPIQNSLAELWGLIQYIDPSGPLFGDKPTFVDLFCRDGDARSASPEQSGELRRRLGNVVQRTLRRQAQEFLEKPFVGRRARLFEYRMSSEERALYNDVTDYLLRPDLYAFQGRSRQLLLLGFHRRMASSIAALAESLERVAARLRRLRGGTVAEDDLEAQFVADLEDEDFEADETEVEGGLPDAPNDCDDELAEVESFVRRARSLPTDSKAESLVTAVRLTMERDDGARKIVIFTESLTTQNYLRDLLMNDAGLGDEEITLFRGSNDSPRALDALRHWRDEVAASMPAHSRPSPSVAVRLALVHEFKTSSKVLISTEAGAKGLNLQFCDTIINYDLPWNPQRIEQRIGRCHRYGQVRDVTVINFIAKDNEAQRLTFDILSSKLDLFGSVLDMSDQVLQTPRSDGSEELATALGPEFESQLRRIWDRARTVEEVEAELRRLRDSMEDSRRELQEIRKQTVGLIETRLDESVREVFRNIRESLPATLADFDADLERVLLGYLTACEIPHEPADTGGSRTLRIDPSPELPCALAEHGITVALGHSSEDESIHTAHPLIEAAIANARASCRGAYRVRFAIADDAAQSLQRRRGSRGRLALTRISYRGFEREDRLLVTAVFEDAEVLQPAAAAHELLLQSCRDLDTFDVPMAVTPDDLDEVVDEELFLDNSAVARAEQAAFEQTMDQLDQYVEDRIMVLRRARAGHAERLGPAEQKRDRALGSDARAEADQVVKRWTQAIERLDEQLGKLIAREDAVYERWKSFAHDRRYGGAEHERLLEAEFILE